MSKIDESLYSRQMYVLGRESMEKITTSNIYVYGLNGLSLEIMKCLILGGVNSILFNISSMKNVDNSNYYYQNQHENVENICQKLKSLNKNVKINCCNTPIKKITGKDLDEYQVMIITQNVEIESLVKLNKLCRLHNIKYVLCNTMGLFGQIFCDFGDLHNVKDIDGEEPKKGIITHVDNYEHDNLCAGISSEYQIITTADPHKLSTDDYITVNGNICKIIKVGPGANILSTEGINDISPQMSYVQHKSSINVKHKDLKSSFDFPTFVQYDIFNENKTVDMHSIFKLLCTGTSISELKNGGHIDCTNGFLSKLCSNLEGNICAMQSVIGSIVAQEVQKGCINKFMPIGQWFYFESIDSVDDKISINKKKYNSRYKDQINIFGTDVQEKLKKSHIFLVGAGAIGCEHIKNMSMMGIGNITVTDMDNIEKSNLSRQFLFRSNDVGQSKSVIAAREGIKMNPHIRINAHVNRVCKETENVYNDDFYNNITIVANALDNIQARLYMDQQCIKYKKPLLESGTLGIKGNTQIIIPHLTETYGSTQDPQEETIPLCTLKNFPYQIEHCIQYARELFENTFSSSIKTFSEYIHNNEEFKKMNLLEITTARNEIIDIFENIPKNTLDCIIFGYKLWIRHFDKQIEDLVVKYPADHVTEQGLPFWSGTKKYPNILKFDVDNQEHVDFIMYVAKLWGLVFSVDVNIDTKKCIAIFKKYIAGKIKIDSKNINENHEFDKDAILKTLPNYSKYSNIHIKPLEFEKDDDSNHHMDFITLASNFRASNYKIMRADKYTTKGIAGKIIPAIATTTSLVSGLVALELYKLFRNETSIESYRNYYINLGIPMFTFSEPGLAQTTIINGKKFSVWDTFEFIDPTPNEVIQHFKDKYEIEIESMYIGSCSVISPLMEKTKYNSRLNKRFSEIYTEILKTNPNDSFSVSVIERDDEGLNEDMLPECIIKLV